MAPEQEQEPVDAVSLSSDYEEDVFLDPSPRSPSLAPPPQKQPTTSNNRARPPSQNPPFRKNTWNKTCERTDCRQKAYYNYPGREPYFCVDHAEQGMVDVAPDDGRVRERKAGDATNGRGVRCEFPNCTTGASFNFSGLRRKFCGRHRTRGMISVVEEAKKERLQAANELEPSTALPTPKTPRRAPLDRQSWESLVTPPPRRVWNGTGPKPKQLCQHENCPVHSSFNYPGQKRKFCATHRLQGMVAVCGYQPGSAKARAYAKLKKIRAEEPPSKLCQEPRCHHPALFAAEGSTEPQFCHQHKLPFQVSTNSHCSVPNCNDFPWFGFIEEDEDEGFCGDHAMQGMVPRHRDTCENWECEGLALFGVAGDWPARWCGEHKPVSAVPVEFKEFEDGE